MRKLFALIIFCLVFVTLVYAAETQMTSNDMDDASFRISNALTTGKIPLGFF